MINKWLWNEYIMIIKTTTNLFHQVQKWKWWIHLLEPLLPFHAAPFGTWMAAFAAPRPFHMNLGLIHENRRLKKKKPAKSLWRKPKYLPSATSSSVRSPSRSSIRIFDFPDFDIWIKNPNGRPGWGSNMIKKKQFTFNNIKYDQKSRQKFFSRVQMGSN